MADKTSKVNNRYNSYNLVSKSYNQSTNSLLTAKIYKKDWLSRSGCVIASSLLVVIFPGVIHKVCEFLSYTYLFNGYGDAC